MENQPPGTVKQPAYFARYAYPDRLISENPGPGTSIIITIPSYNEPDLTQTLSSLSACAPPDCMVEVLVLENYPENETKESFYQLPNHISHPNISFKVIRKSLPVKKAGVGLARKIIMDEAAWRLTALDKPNGLIVALDADCTVAPNYLQALHRFQSSAPEPAASIYYEHPTQGSEPPEIYRAIIEYELHLRFYVHAQRWAGAQYAYQTVGSAMAVRNATYQSVGGMNTRKAGEDFYFLQKVMPHGFTEIRETCVYPSPRISHRVPFGTGRAVSERVSTHQERTSYAPESFRILREFYLQSEAIYRGHNPNIHPYLTRFLTELNAQDEFRRMRSISGNPGTFIKHFHTWFDGFHLMKCLHYLRECGIQDIPVTDSARWLLEELGMESPSDVYQLLLLFRKMDKGII